MLLAILWALVSFLVLQFTSKALRSRVTSSVVELPLNPEDSEVPDNATATQWHTWWRSRGCSSISSLF